MYIYIYVYVFLIQFISLFLFPCLDFSLFPVPFLLDIEFTISVLYHTVSISMFLFICLCALCSHFLSFFVCLCLIQFLSLCSLNLTFSMSLFLCLSLSLSFSLSHCFLTRAHAKATCKAARRAELHASAVVRVVGLKGAHQMNGLECVLRSDDSAKARWVLAVQNEDSPMTRPANPSRLWKMVRPSCTQDKLARRMRMTLSVPSCVMIPWQESMAHRCVGEGVRHALTLDGDPVSSSIRRLRWRRRLLWRNVPPNLLYRDGSL